MKYRRFGISLAIIGISLASVDYIFRNVVDLPTVAFVVGWSGWGLVVIGAMVVSIANLDIDARRAVGLPVGDIQRNESNSQASSREAAKGSEQPDSERSR